MNDFTPIFDVAVPFSSTELDSGVDFTPSGDMGQVIVQGAGFGEGGFGEGVFGGSDTIILGSSPTIWTNIETP